jgi:hypothetical protein
MRNNGLAMVTFCILAVLLLAAACERTVTTVNETYTASACFDCHSDQNTELVSAEGQWNYSQHASGANVDRNTTPCQVCHTSQGFVAKVTGATVPNPVENPTMIHCFTCHAPHTNSNLDLRVTAAQTLQNGESYDMNGANICASCHQSRRNVNTYVEEPTELSQRWGPHHGPQSDMLWGTNGYEYAAFGPYGDTNHRGAAEDGCLDCHYKVVNSYFLSGHSFNMKFIAEGDTALNTDACEQCHSSTDDFNLGGVQDTVHTLLEDLENLLFAAGLLDAERHPLEVTTSQDSAGAVWNYLIVEEDRSLGVHNKQYAIDLLNSAIQFMQTGPTPPVAGKVEDEDVVSRK